MADPQITIALAGNPNAGKTSLFNHLTGARQHVANYPGVTVETKKGTARLDGQTVHVVDLPGTYSLTAYSPEELVARDYVISQRPDVVIDVVDASNLERNLYLALQFMEMGAPLVIALNMMDMAEGRGLKIDVAQLSSLLGVPVVPTVARSGRGIDKLLQTAVELARSKPAWHPLTISYGSDVDQALSEALKVVTSTGTGEPLLAPRWVALKCLENDPEVLGLVKEDPHLAEAVLTICQRATRHIRATTDDEPENIIADYRYGFINGIYRKAVQESRADRLDFTDKIDKVVTSRWLGPLLLLGILYLIYQFVFWASEAPVAWFESFFAWLGQAVTAILPAGLLQSLLVSGVIDGVGGVLGFVPIIAFMFFAIAALEDSGYMARVAYMLDRVLRGFGLHGNSVMALIVGGGISGGCAVPGVMATRTLKDPRARLATILTVPFMNCGAKLPVYALLISAFFAVNKAQMMFALTIISWSLALLAARLLRSTILKGEQAPFVMELPPYRVPTLKGLLIHTWERSWAYIRKAGTVILSVSVVMWALMAFPSLPAKQAKGFDQRLAAAQGKQAKKVVAAQKAEAALAHSLGGRLGKALGWVTSPLGFDWRTNVALVGGFAAKEVIVSTLGTAYSLGEVDPEEAEGLARRLQKTAGWNPLMAFALMIFVMVYAPCFVTVVVTKKETGSWRWALFGLTFSTLSAYVLALLVHQGGRALGLG